MRALPIDLPSVLDASFVDLGLYDGTDEPSLPPDIEADQALADYTVHRLQPVVVPVVSLDTRFPRAMGYLRTCGAESVCVLPLAVGERRLGMLVAGSRSPYTYAAFDLEFLMVIARQVAMALDQAGRLDALQRAVTHERDKLNAWRGPTNS
jgi:GAF domain-containing protein